MTEQPTPDAFASLDALMQIIADPKAAAKRLGELRAASDDLARREAKLAADLAAFAADREKAVAEIAAQRSRIADRWNELADDRNHAYIADRVIEARAKEKAQ